MSEWVDNHEEEESSFVSMADMMVGLLLIFIILLTYYVLRSQQEISEADRVSKTEQAAVAARGIILNQIRDRINDDRIEFDAMTGTIRFSEEVLTFEPGDFGIPAAAEPVLEKLASALTATLPCLAHLPDQKELDCDWLDQEFEMQNIIDRDLGHLNRFRPEDAPPLIWIDGVFVEGHTDCTLFNSADPDFRNWVLGSQRAANTYRFLTSVAGGLGEIFSKDPEVDGTAHRILGVASYADRRPARNFEQAEYPSDHRLSDNPSTACQVFAREERNAAAGIMTQNRRNRRIDIRIVMGWTTRQMDGVNGP